MVRTTHIVCALLAFGLAAPTRAAETEVRQFNVSVDGKPSGHYTMAFTKESDGSLSIACDAHVKVKVALITAYHYDFVGKEVWKDGRLQSLSSHCDDDGKKFTVVATAGERGLSVKVNGRERTVRGDVYLTTACCLPDAKRRDGALPLMEADNGEEINGKFQPVGTHYRLMSHGPHDVWYDAAGRLVRQEWTEDGHKTVLELVKR
jgi:YD repeat-containing protein